MKNRFKFVSILLVAAAATSAFADSGEEFIKKQYSDLSIRTMKKDTVGLRKSWNAIVHPQFETVQKDMSGRMVKMNGKSFMDTFLSQFGMITKFDLSKNTVKKFIKKGSTIVATVSSEYAFTLKTGEKTKPMKVSGVSVSDDTWVLVGESWKLKGIKNLSEKMLYNGKPAPSGSAG